MLGPIVVYGKGKAMHHLCQLLELLHIDYHQMDDEDTDIDRIIQAQYIIATPGIKPTHRLYTDYSDHIVSELSFLGILKDQGYFDRWKSNITLVGITGTNGKSTTTWMMYQMLCKIEQAQCNLFDQRHKQRGCDISSHSVHIHIGGNFDKPLSGILHDIISGSLVSHRHLIVLEVSSFMLWRLQNFHFDIGVFLNLARDHQDRHKDMSDYLLAKSNILFHADIAITSESLRDDLEYVQYHPNLGGKVIKRTVRTRLKTMISGLFARQGHEDIHRLVIYRPYDLSNPAFVGEHNRYNAGAVHEVLQQLFGHYDQALRSQIPAIPHRLQTLDPIHGITIVDDGICTSAHALSTAIKSQLESFVLVCGGYDAGDDYSVLKTFLLDKKPYIIVYGQIASHIYVLAKQSGLVCMVVPTLEEAMESAFTVAKQSALTRIVFSPGAKSFDLFDNVYHRIRVFEEIVEKLRE